VIVRFRNNKLRRAFEKQKFAVGKWGPKVGPIYIRRIRSIQAVEKFEDLRKLPQLAFHSLTGNRSGEFAISIIGKIRLILKKEIIDGTEGAIIWEVSDHYE